MRGSSFQKGGGPLSFWALFLLLKPPKKVRLLGETKRPLIELKERIKCRDIARVVGAQAIDSAQELTLEGACPPRAKHRLDEQRQRILRGRIETLRAARE